MSDLQPTAPPIILTLKLDQATFEIANALRTQYFPPARNFLPAHITLFHALPGDRLPLIEAHLYQVCSQTATMVLDLPTLRFLGKGVAIEVSAPDLVQFRKSLVEPWNGWLTAQDRQGYRPHITIQNKVAATEARQVYEQLLTNWQPLKGNGEGVLLWYYRNGPWEFVNEFSFI